MACGVFATWRNCGEKRGGAMSDGALSVFVGTLGLQAALLLALLTALRPSNLTHARMAAIATLLLQLVHMFEEWSAGFPERLPAALGLAPWPSWFFPAFNAAWIAAWIIAIVSGASGYLARAALWFLAIAAIVNAIAHPILAIRVGAYFPGLYTAPLLGVAGIWLAMRLRIERR
jgi:hypothetical protein